MRKTLILTLMVASGAFGQLSSPTPAFSSLPAACSPTSFPNVILLTVGTLGVYACTAANTWTFAGGGGGGGSGTVTNVSWTGGIVSVSAPTTTPSFTISGTSGGIPYFNSASTWTSSGALGAGLPLVGGGAGVAPSTGTKTGTGTLFPTWSGATTASKCVHTDGSGNIAVTGADCAAGFGSLGDDYFVTDGSSAVVHPSWTLTGGLMMTYLGGSKQQPGSSNDFVTSTTGIYLGIYTSGITATGPAGSTCSLSSFNGGGSGATATITLSGTNTIAGGTPISFTAAGTGYGSPTSATASSESATCSGTAALSASVGSTVSFHFVPPNGQVVEVIQ